MSKEDVSFIYFQKDGKGEVKEINPPKVESYDEGFGKLDTRFKRGSSG